MNNFLRILKNKLGFYLNILNTNKLISYLCVFSIFFVIFAFTYMTTNNLSSSDDHYFHIRFAEQMRQVGFLDSFNNFKAVYFSKSAHGISYMYYNFLFYLLLIPFTFIVPLYLGIKLYAVFILAVISVSMYFVFRSLKITNAFLWTAGFFAVVGLSPLFRLFLSRPYVLAPTILLFVLLFLHKKKYVLVLISSCLYVIWHGATFFLPFFIGCSYFISNILYTRKYNWKILIYTFSGVLGGVAITYLFGHGFFTYINDDLISVLKDFLSNKKINIPEGNELYPKNFFDFINQNVLFFFLFMVSIVSGCVIYFKKYTDNKKENFRILDDSDTLVLSLFLISTVFFVAISSFSNRFSDFFIFFGWIFIVLILNLIIKNISFNTVVVKNGFFSGILIAMLYLFGNNLLQIRDFFGSNPNTFVNIGNYIDRNVPKGDIVFDTNWSWFPQLYYYAPNVNYVVGLEPKLTYQYNQEIYWLWSHIGDGYVCNVESCQDKMDSIKKLSDEKFAKKWKKEEGDAMAEILINKFSSHTVVTSKDYRALNFVLQNNDRFKLELKDNNLYVYTVLNK
ncbi:MAG: hypothetical protein NTX85_01260 [Candidatus Nomurabacteria bacterium]|nr:hypothetical protein [Candidatus Nomurabacteria bacterium]